MAGQKLLRLLNKLHAEHKVNWLEASPRALRIYHDRVGETGYSPYQLLYGRERPLGGLPYTPLRQCQDAEDFMLHMSAMDTLIAAQLNDLHHHQAEGHNSTTPDRPAYRPGDRVCILRPRHVGGDKMESWWSGPCVVDQRLRECS